MTPFLLLRLPVFFGNSVDQVFLAKLVDLLLSLTGLLSVHLLHFEGLLALRVKLDVCPWARVDRLCAPAEQVQIAGSLLEDGRVDTTLVSVSQQTVFYH